MFPSGPIRNFGSAASTSSTVLSFALPRPWHFPLLLPRTRHILNGEPFANIANVRNAEQLADFAHASDNLRLATAAAVVAAAVSFVSHEALGNRYKDRSCLP